MNEKEISELRRRLKPEKQNISHIRGCYVNEKREILSLFDQSLALLPEEESEKYLALLKRTLAGTPGKNLVDLAFTTAQVADSDEHRLLMALRDSELRDEAAVQLFFQKAVSTLQIEGNYLILLAADVYDVPYRAADGARDGDASSEVFRYILCSVCPVKPTKPALSYSAAQNAFHSRRADWVVGAPELGFLFPAFDDRAANLYGALYCTKDTSALQEDFLRGLFGGAEAPMPADEQRETFQALLRESLDGECRFEVVRAVHEEVRDRLEAHKLNKEDEPPRITRSEMRDAIASCGVSQEGLDAFDARFCEAFGEDQALPTGNLAAGNKFEVRTPDVLVQVNAARSDLVETRVIDGRRYIVIRAEGEVEVNGVSVRMAQPAGSSV